MLLMPWLQKTDEQREERVVFALHVHFAGLPSLPTPCASLAKGRMLQLVLVLGYSYVCVLRMDIGYICTTSVYCIVSLCRFIIRFMETHKLFFYCVASEFDRNTTYCKLFFYCAQCSFQRILTARDSLFLVGKTLKDIDNLKKLLCLLSIKSVFDLLLKTRLLA
jgi:hypothetical protein